MTTIIQCPSCQSRYRLKFEIADGQQVRCPNCQTVWRYQAESMLEPLEAQQEAPQPAPQRERAPAGYQDDGGRRPNSAPAPDNRAHQQPAWGGAAQQEPQQQPAWGAAAHQQQEPQRQESWNSQAADVALDAFWNRGRETGSSAGTDMEHGYDPAIAAAPAVRDAPSLGGYAPGHAQQEEAGIAQQPGWASELAAAMNQGGRHQDFQAGEPSVQDFAANYAPAQPQYGANAEADAGEGADFWRTSPVEDQGGQNGASFGEIGPDGEWQPMSFDGGPPEARRGSLALAAAWGVYLTIIAGLAAGAILMRDSVAQAMPGAATLYAKVGLAPAAAPLNFEQVAYAWVMRDNRPALEVRGIVVNQTSASVTVPPLRIAVRDNQDQEIAKTTATVVKERLGPHGKSPFTLEFLSAPQTVSEIELQLEK